MSEFAAALARAAGLRPRSAFETLVQFLFAGFRFWSHIMTYGVD